MSLTTIPHEQLTSGGSGTPDVALGAMGAAGGWAKSKSGAITPPLTPH